MRRKICLAVALVLALLCACALGSTHKDRADGYAYVIGVSQSNLIEPMQIAIYEEMRSHIDGYPQARLVFTDAAGDSVRQRENIAHLLELDVDILIITPVGAYDLEESLALAKERGIKTIILGSRIEGGGYDMFIGPDDYAVGQLAAAHVAALLGPAGGTVVEMTGTATSLPAQQMSAGFADGLAAFDQMELVGSLDGDWLRDTAERRMKDFLILNAHVDVLFAHSDAMAYGAHVAAQDFRVRNIAFLGVGGQEDQGKTWVDYGILESTVYSNTGSTEAIDWALKILQGETNFPPEVVWQPQLYTKGQ